MIIDTESPEGRALVALAKFSDRLISSIEMGADFSLGAIRLAQVLKTAGLLDEFGERTDLAKLPEGI